MGKKKRDPSPPSHSVAQSPPKAKKAKLTHANEIQGLSAASLNSVTAKNNGNSWPTSDLLELINRIENQIPENDTLRHKKRMERLNWLEISFGGYSVEDCKNKFNDIEKRIRGFRILSEILADAKIWATHPWTNFYQRKSNNKHPDMPRRPLSSYMLYYMAKKDKVHEERPDLDMISVSRLIAESFNKLPDKKKNKYAEKAKVLRAKYLEQMEQFSLEHPELEEVLKKPSSKAAKDQSDQYGLSAKPLTPFKLFVKSKLERHEQDKDFNAAKVSERSRLQWKKLTDKKKLVWIKWAVEQEAAYLEERKEFQQQHPDLELPSVKSILTKEESQILERNSGKPIKPPSSAYGLFSRLMLQEDELKDKFTSPKERMSEVARLWKLVPPVEKATYNEKVKHMREEYKLNYASYLESLPAEKRAEELEKDTQKRKKVGLTILKQSHVISDTPNKKNGEAAQACIMGEPERPNMSVFQFFMENNPALLRLPPDYRTEEGQKQFNKLSPQELKKYKKKLLQLKANYIAEFRCFLNQLNPEELKQYSRLKAAQNKIAAHSEEEHEEDTEDEDDEEKEEDEDEEVDARANQRKMVPPPQNYKELSEDEDSSSSASSSNNSDES